MQSVDLLDSKRFCEALSVLTLAWGDQDLAKTAEALDALLAMARGTATPIDTWPLAKEPAKLGRAKGTRNQSNIVKPRLQRPKPEPEPAIEPKKKGGWPKGKPRKAEKLAAGLTDSEAKHYAALADQAAKDNPPIAERMDRLMQQVVLPKVRQGIMRIAMPEKFEGRPLPSSNKTWLEALGRAGIHRQELEWGAGADGMSIEAAGAVSLRILKLG